MSPELWVLVGLAVFVGAVLAARRAGLRAGSSEFVCDGCKYNSVELCARPERPNATSSCPDFKARG